VIKFQPGVIVPIFALILGGETIFAARVASYKRDWLEFELRASSNADEFLDLGHLTIWDLLSDVPGRRSAKAATKTTGCIRLSFQSR
jgi:hypothetical protein